MSLSGKVAVITGGGQGIGKAISKAFLMKGMSIVIAEVDKEAGEETQKEYEEVGPVQFIHIDISSEDDVKRCIKETTRHFRRLDVLINNAAVSVNKPITKLTLNEWDRVIGVNLTGAFLFAKYSAPHLKKTKGIILNMASTRAFMSETDTEAYSASKGGIVALTHALAVSLGPHVRVNCISPGWVEVRGWKKKSRRTSPNLSEADHLQHPAGRVGTPEDIASIAEFLISDQAGFITGANFIADGGMTRKMIYV
jgi:NAD(P)-dependent dehydrogenase (short-subunit alcohol dehydrogenase family)